MERRRTLALACPHAAATGAGREAFADGGTAVDAALAACATLTVVYPHMCSIGGDAIALVHAPDGTITAVNGSGAAPAALGAARVRAALERDPAPVTRTGMPVRGPHTVTVPGVLAAWETIRGLGGILPLDRLLRPAIECAAGGCTISRSLAETLASEPGLFAADPGLREVFFRTDDVDLALGRPARPGDGRSDPESPPSRDVRPPRDAAAPRDVRALAEGDVFSMPALAGSLETLARDGIEAFYRGELGARYVAGLRAAGSVMTGDDLVAHATEVGPPLRGAAFGHQIITAPPNSQGYVLLQLLAAMERLAAEPEPTRSRQAAPGRPPDPLGPAAAPLARLFRLTSAERDRHLCDPRAHDVPLDELLRTDHLRDLARRAAAPAGGGPGPEAAGRPAPAAGDTIACVAADSDGWAVSIIQSVYHGFGAAILEPSTGIVAHDRGACFSLDSSSPNLLEGGKRPLHTLMPVMVRHDGRLAIVAGTMGGEAQPQIHAQVLSRLLGVHPAPADGPALGARAPGIAATPGSAAVLVAAAVAAPRWIYDEGGLFAEADVPEPCLAALHSTGMPVELLEAADETVGHAQYITIAADGAMQAASDPRADGDAVVRSW